MRILATGDRFWVDPPMAARIIRRLVERYGSDVTIFHGGATGVDEAFATAATGAGLGVEAHSVTDDEWRTVGKRAAMQRNGRMVAAGADLCIAVHRYIFNSKGSKDCARQAIAAGIPAYLIDSEKSVPKRLADDPRLE